MSGCKPDALAAWRREHRIGAPRRTRTCNMPLLRRPPLPVGLPARTRDRLRTCTFRRLRPGLFRLGYAGEEMVRSERLELPRLATTASETVVSAHSTTSAWCRRSESNTRPLPYQGLALPLCYDGKLEPAASSRTCISPGTNRRLCRLSYAGMVLAGGVKPPASALRERRSVN